MSPIADIQDEAPALEVRGLGKAYKVYATPRERLKALLLGHANVREQWVLRDVSFTLPRGRCLGVIGSNGAGKSSLLKLVAGTLMPSTGAVARAGRLTAILELGAGFHPEFTGRENLFFSGQLIGISEAQMRELTPEIIAWSELGDAIDRPVKAYSSGMVVRLAFALVTAVPPRILIVDEALAVGDQHFQKKCIERIESFRRDGCSILFCSHSMYHVRQLCDEAIWLDQGQVRGLGPTEAVVSAYEAHVRQLDAAADATPLAAVETGASPPLAAPVARGAAELLTVTASPLKAEPGQALPLLEGTELKVQLVARGSGDEQPNFGVMIEQLHGAGVASVGTHLSGFDPVRGEDGLWRATVRFPDLPLLSGEYVVSAYLFDSAGLVTYQEWLQYLPFRVVYPSVAPGLVRLSHEWS